MPYFWHFEPNTRIVSHLRIWTLHSQPILLHHHFVAQYLNVITYILYTRFQLRFRIDHVYGALQALCARHPRSYPTPAFIPQLPSGTTLTL